MSHENQAAIDLIQRLPDDAATADIIEELYFEQQVDKGLRDVVEGRLLSHTELKERIAKWRKSTGRLRRRQTCVELKAKR
ncbi:MAG: hypothetical protein IH861_05545 [Chloroflexi bacterium]|nr:hypothetical protein [Chloroflexota bacterium]